MNNNQQIIAAVIDYLQEKYSPEIIFVYGSRACGSAGPESDVDVMGFCRKPLKKKEARLINGVFLDSWFYDLEELKSPSDRFFCLLDGYCALDSQNRGQNFLKKVREIFDRGPEKCGEEDSDHLIQWVNKMLKRVPRGDVEGNYRRQWLTVDLLPIYFQLRNMWYLGSKKSFEWLRENDPVAAKLFHEVLEAPVEFEKLSQLAKYVIKQG